MVRQSARTAKPKTVVATAIAKTKTEVNKVVGAAKRKVAAAVHHDDEPSEDEKEEEPEQEKKAAPKKRKTAAAKKDDDMPLAARTAVSSLKRAMYIGAHVSGAGGTLILPSKPDPLLLTCPS